eukprot:12343938-Ditylum_brightwellii.AAC.1
MSCPRGNDTREGINTDHTLRHDRPGYKEDLHIPTQALPRKVTKAQRVITNTKYHGHTMKKKDENWMRLYFQNINRIPTTEDLQ